MENTNTILEQIKNSVLATDPDATLILYGSFARGDNREGSDIDILVLIDKPRITYDDQIRIGHPLYHLELKTGILISPMIFAKPLWETKHRITPFYKNVMLEGRIL